MSLAMTWDEWAAHDAVGLAEKVRRGEVTAAELAAQAAAGVAKVNPALSAVVEVFADAVADPLQAGVNAEGPLAGVPFFMKDLGPPWPGGCRSRARSSCAATAPPKTPGSRGRCAARG